jgi:hypothetical protein
MSTQVFVPDDFYCPITGELMVDPVSDTSGNTFEKSAIHRWLSSHSTNPMDRTPLTISDLNPNPTVKKSIDQIRDKLTSEQLKIQSRIHESQSKNFTDGLDQIRMESHIFENKLFVSVKMPDNSERAPVDLVLCIDVSGSMGSEAVLRGDKGETVGHGFSVLSLTVSAAKTILESLNEKDNISIVTYTDKASIVFSHVACNPANKKSIATELDKLTPKLTTNIWDGLHVSLDILRKNSPPNRLSSIMLLTDGVPNIVPPRGHENMISKYFRENEYHSMISCYGFGYSLDSELLMNMSNLTGSDGFSYIPDASLLGNIFIHGISNLLTTAIVNPTMKITLEKNATFDDLSSEKVISIPSLKYGQDKHYIFDIDTRGVARSQMPLSQCAKISLTLNGEVFESTDTETTQSFPSFAYEQIFRMKAISILDASIEKMKYGSASFIKELEDFISEMKSNCYTSKSVYIQNILFDFQGQVKEALNMTTAGEQGNWFGRWGMHYLRSLSGAYQNEICNNFKDKGVSNFGGELFETIRDRVSDIFDDQPAPKRDVVSSYSASRGYQSGGTVAAGASAAPASVPRMSMYNNAGGGCCAKGCRIQMADNTYKNVEDVLKGDLVITVDENLQRSVGKIECLVETECVDNKQIMVELGNLKITPYHPVINLKDKKKMWEFPVSMGYPLSMSVSTMYTFVVSNRQSVIVEDYLFATYGHHQEGEVIAHEYFGTEEVIRDLQEFDSYMDGIVCLTQDMFQRGSDSRVCRIVKGNTMSSVACL